MVPLWDILEKKFASDEVLKNVLDMEEQANIIEDNESKEQKLVGEAHSIVAEAGQI